MTRSHTFLTAPTPTGPYRKRGGFGFWAGRRRSFCAKRKDPANGELRGHRGPGGLFLVERGLTTLRQSTQKVHGSWGEKNWDLAVARGKQAKSRKEGEAKSSLESNNNPGPRKKSTPSLEELLLERKKWGRGRSSLTKGDGKENVRPMNRNWGGGRKGT